MAYNCPVIGEASNATHRVEQDVSSDSADGLNWQIVDNIGNIQQATDGIVHGWNLSFGYAAA